MANRRGLNQYATSGMSPMERFEHYVSIEDRGFGTPCWMWTGNGRTHNGYGEIAITDRPGHQRRLVVHRWRWEQDNGPVPDGLQLDHLCRQRLCVRPNHLEPVTAAENSRRGRNRKISDDQAREIYRRAHAGEVGAQIARDFGVDRKLVYLIRDHGPDGLRDPAQNARHRARRKAKALG